MFIDKEPTLEDLGMQKGNAQGQMTFWDNTLKKWVHTETSELFWDNTNKRLGIGTDSPDEALHVESDSTFSGVGLFKASRTGVNDAFFEIKNASNLAGKFIGLFRSTSNQNGFGMFVHGRVPAVNDVLATGGQAGTDAMIILEGTRDDDSTIQTANILNVRNRFTSLMMIDKDGNMGINATTPDTKLQVVGSTKFGDDNTNYVTTDTSGRVLYVGNAGVAIGEIFVNDNTTVTSVSSAGFTQFLHFDTNGHSNNTAPSAAENHITITKAGIYMVDCCVNVKNSSGAAHDIEVVISKNNNASIFPNMRRHRTLGTGNDVGAIPICGHISLEVNDTLELWITSNSATTRNIIAEDVTLMVTQVGGT